MINNMKNPKLIDEAWIDEQIDILSNATNQYQHVILRFYKLLKSVLQPVPTDILTKTNVEKIRAGELEIENDDREATIKCCVSLFEDGDIVDGNYKYYYAWEKDLNMWYACNTTTLPTIKASELIKEIEGEKECKRFCGENYCDENGCTNRKRVLVEPTEPTTEWQPKFGEVVEVRDDTDEKWVERIFLFAHAGFYYCVDKADDDIFMDKTGPIEIVVWSEMQKTGTLPTMTLAEAEAKLGVKIVMP